MSRSWAVRLSQAWRKATGECLMEANCRHPAAPCRKPPWRSWKRRKRRWLRSSRTPSTNLYFTSVTTLWQRGGESHISEQGGWNTCTKYSLVINYNDLKLPAFQSPGRRPVVYCICRHDGKGTLQYNYEVGEKTRSCKWRLLKLCPVSVELRRRRGRGRRRG